MSVQRLRNWLMVRPSEDRLLAYLGLLALANGLGLAFGRSSSDALFFKRFGVEYLPHMYFLTSILLVIFSTVYVEFTDRVRPARMLLAIFFVLATFLLVCWFFMARGSGTIAFAVYFLGVSVAAEMTAVHFSWYASQFFDFNQSKRLTPLIDASSRLGRVLGGLLMVLVAKHWPTEVMALLWAGILVCCMSLVALRHHGEARCPKRPTLRKRAAFADVREGLRFAQHSPLLQLTGVGVFLMIILVSIQDYVASTIITQHFQNEQDLAAFFGWFFAFTNAMVLLLQIALTNHLVHRFGLKVVNLIFPASTALSFALLSISASFLPALIGRFNYMGMLPAFRSPVFNLFYSALPRYIQGRARAMSVGLILPLGLGCAGLLLLWVPKSMVGQPLALVGLALSMLYIFVKFRKNQVYSSSLLALIQRQVFTDKSPMEGIGRFSDEVAQRVVELVRQADQLQTARTYIDLLVEHAPQHAAELLQQDLNSLPPPLIEYLMQNLAASELPSWRAALQAGLQHEQVSVQITATRLLVALGDAASLQPMLEQWLNDDQPQRQAQAAQVFLQHPNLQATARAEAKLSDLLHGTPAAQIYALSVLEALGEITRPTPASALLNAPDQTVRAAAVHCCVALSAREAERAHIISAAIHDAEDAVRMAAAQTLHWMSDTQTRLASLQTLLRDPAYAVRCAAQQATEACMPQTAVGFDHALSTYADQFALQTKLCSQLAKSELAEKDEILIGVAQSHLRTAYDKKALAQRLKHQTGLEYQFLVLLLQEDMQQHLDLILEILCLRDTGQVMPSVQAALQSENRRLRAQALESLRNAADSKWMLDLCAFLESQFDHAPLAHHSSNLPESGQETLQWCTRHGSAWLKQCATVLLKTVTPDMQNRV